MKNLLLKKIPSILAFIKVDSSPQLTRPTEIVFYLKKFSSGIKISNLKTSFYSPLLELKFKTLGSFSKV